MAIKYTNIFYCKTLQKFTQIVRLGLKNMPSGNPDSKRFQTFRLISLLDLHIYWPIADPTTSKFTPLTTALSRLERFPM
jgi:hypothetical protein